MSTLYNQQDKKTMQYAEDALNPRIDRIKEIIDYANKAGIKKLGIANCIAFQQEAGQLEDILQKEGFEVSKVNCKYGRMPFDEIIPGYRGIACNPAGQAKHLEEKGSELNIMMGLCLGHDMLFNSKSKAPVTPLVVKDRKLKHNTLQAFREGRTHHPSEKEDK